MATGDSTNSSLAAFLAELDRRLDLLGPTGSRDALRAAAARLSPSQRPAFLALFDDAAGTGDDALLAEIDALVVDFPTMAEDLVEQQWRRREWDDRWDDEDVSPVSDAVDDLYRRLGERFLAGDWQVVAAGYRRLLQASVEDVDSPDGYIIGGSAELVREGMVRYVHALLADHSIPVPERAAAVVEAIDDYGSTAGYPAVTEILRAHPDQIEDRDELLTLLGGICEERSRTSTSWNASEFHDLALDIAVELGGPDALARLARDESASHRDRSWERWMTELATVARVVDAIAVGAEALASIGASPDRAHLADLLGSYQRRSGDFIAALETDTVAFTDRPSLRRLRQILEDAETANQPTPLSRLIAAAQRADPLIQLALRLLDRHVDHIAPLIGTIQSRYSTTLDATAIEIAALLRTSTAPTGRHIRLCDERIMTLDGRHALHDAVIELGTDPGDTREPDPGPLAPRVIAALDAIEPDADRLGVAAGLVDGLAAAVMSNKWRGSYALAAQLVVALALTSQAVGLGMASSVIVDYDRTYRRFSAFRKELQRAAKNAV